MTKQISYEEVVVDQSLPTLIKHPTPRQLVMWAGASGEFSEMHYDKEFALSRGFPGIIVHGMLMTSFLAQVLTDWMGEGGTLKKIKTSNRQFVLVDQDILCKGKVTHKYLKGEEHFVECELWAENQAGEKCVAATAVVTLPERKEVASCGGMILRSDKCRRTDHFETFNRWKRPISVGQGIRARGDGVPGWQQPGTPVPGPDNGSRRNRRIAKEKGEDMAGISSYGGYIPYYRLSRAEIARAWEGPPAPGERAIAGYDEDSLTMGVEAALDCLKEVAKESIDGLFFASTSAPYKDKQSAATIAMVLGLKTNTVTMDFGGSLRSGTNALRAAVDIVKSGSAKNILVIASELRLAYPSGPFEMNFGDGAVALLISDTHVIAEIEDAYSVYEELQDIWRSDRDTFVRSAEDRFIIDEGFNRVVPAAVSSALQKFNLTQKEITRCVLYLPNQRQVPGLVKRLGFDPKTQFKDGLFAKVGDAGTAMGLMLLVETLEEAKPDQRILLVNYGNGCDVFSIRTLKGVENGKGSRRAIQGYTASKALLSNYNRYLRWHQLVMIQPPARPALEIRQPGPQAQWRENENVFRLRGTKCNHCGTPQYPPQRVCVVCRTKDDFEPYSFVDKKAKVYTFSHDFIMQTPDPPVTIAMVDFEGGGRLMCDLTDRNPEQIKVGMPVEMTFRKLYYVGGIHNYWWKARPIR